MQAPEAKINLIVFSFIRSTGILNQIVQLSDANELCPFELFYVACHKLPWETQNDVVRSGGCFRKDVNKQLNWSKCSATVVVSFVSISGGNIISSVNHQYIISTIVSFRES